MPLYFTDSTRKRNVPSGAHHSKRDASDSDPHFHHPSSLSNSHPLQLQQSQSFHDMLHSETERILSKHDKLRKDYQMQRHCKSLKRFFHSNSDSIGEFDNRALPHHGGGESIVSESSASLSRTQGSTTRLNHAPTRKLDTMSDSISTPGGNPSNNNTAPRQKRLQQPRCASTKKQKTPSSDPSKSLLTNILHKERKMRSTYEAKRLKYSKPKKVILKNGRSSSRQASPLRERNNISSSYDEFSAYPRAKSPPKTSHSSVAENSLIQSSPWVFSSKFKEDDEPHIVLSIDHTASGKEKRKRMRQDVAYPPLVVNPTKKEDFIELNQSFDVSKCSSRQFVKFGDRVVDCRNTQGKRLVRSAGAQRVPHDKKHTMDFLRKSNSFSESEARISRKKRSKSPSIHSKVSPRKQQYQPATRTSSPIRQKKKSTNSKIDTEEVISSFPTTRLPQLPKNSWLKHHEKRVHQEPQSRYLPESAPEFVHNDGRAKSPANKRIAQQNTETRGSHPKKSNGFFITEGNTSSWTQGHNNNGLNNAWTGRLRALNRRLQAFEDGTRPGDASSDAEFDQVVLRDHKREISIRRKAMALVAGGEAS